MYSAQLTEDIPQSDVTFTQQMYPQKNDDWLVKQIRDLSSKTYQQQNLQLTAGTDIQHYNGTNGTSKLDRLTSIIRADVPFKEGTAFIQVDRSHVDAGTLNGAIYNWGTCGSHQGCLINPISQEKIRYSYAMGWHDQYWSGDIGIQSSDILGGISYQDQFKDYRYQLTFDRRLIASSVLSFAGLTDYWTGKEWGRVKNNLLKLDVSKPLSNRDGIWASTELGRQQGKNTIDNSSAKLSGGYYYNLILLSQTQKLVIGMNSQYLHYDKDLNDYRFGHGGYYSPQQYWSIGLPISWARQIQNSSWGVQANLQYAYAKTDHNSSQGFGYNISVFAEQRLSSHIAVGTKLKIEHEKDYAPNSGLIYLKYFHKDWNGPLGLNPIQPMPY